MEWLTILNNAATVMLDNGFRVKSSMQFPSLQFVDNLPFDRAGAYSVKRNQCYVSIPKLNNMPHVKKIELLTHEAAHGIDAVLTEVMADRLHGLFKCYTYNEHEMLAHFVCWKLNLLDNVFFATANNNPIGLGVIALGEGYSFVVRIPKSWESPLQQTKRQDVFHHTTIKSWLLDRTCPICRSANEAETLAFLSRAVKQTVA